MPDLEYRVVVVGHGLCEARQVRPRVRTQHRVARQVVGIVGGQVERGVERLLEVGHGVRGGFDTLLPDRHVAPMTAGQTDVASHLLLERQREELLGGGEHAVERGLVDAGTADVEEADFACRPSDLGRDPVALGGVR